MTRWSVVTRAEIEAAEVAPLLPQAIDAIDAIDPAAAIAVLTNNDEAAIDTFLGRFPHLRARVRVVVGRRALGGPKTDFAVFAAGYAICRQALGATTAEPELAPEIEPKITYVGDMDYELDYAGRLGAEIIDVRQLDATAPGAGTG
jgi:hypothetical protein